MVAVLDRIAVGVVAVDRAMRLVHCNDYARDLLQRGSSLGVAGGLLSCPQSADTVRLRLAVIRCLDDQAPLPTVFRLYDHRLAEFVEIAVLRCGPLTDTQPLVAIFVRSPDPQRAVCDALLAPLYGLTRAERQMAALVTQEGSVTVAAKVRGVSASTARTHLRSLLRKTGARRQVDLVQRLSTGLGGMIRFGTAATPPAQSPVMTSERASVLAVGER
jgi:DNA-binding CsgD family transcriptional regulator